MYVKKNRMTRRRNFINQSEFSPEKESYSSSTGLTQVINILDIGSSTPTRSKRKATSPVAGVVKVR